MVKGRLAGDDRGTALILAIGLVAIAATLLAVAADVAVLHLRHRSGQLAADAAARAGAQQLDLAAYYGAPGALLPLDPRAARQRAAAHLATGDGGWRLADVQVGGADISVTVDRQVELPFPVPGGPGTVTVSASGVAQLRAQQ